jgi:maltose alpha-D-glucosyltransferase / alpha-amylase
MSSPAGAPPDPGDALWYKDAILYELRVGTFQDSNGDGVGDFRGLTQRLDYLVDLGVTALWLLPFCPSPGRDDGYDIADYTDVHPDYGTLDDFEVFLDEAHDRGLRVVTELVINHTSDRHPWFQRARRAPPGSRWRNFYVWSDSPEKYREARVIFRDFEPSNWSWDPVAKSYYWHRFYAHQPDLNFDSPDVRRAVMRFLDFWLRLGVDGLRLDAIPYLYEREGTSCENLPETHAFLKDVRSHVDARYPGRMLLAEANQWPEDAVAYFGHGDECHMAFHFPVMPRLFMALHMEDRFPIIDILDQTPPIPEICQWAMFLRNHDELTLEMVTDEERDVMYRVYAQDARARINLGIRRRLAPLLGNDRRRIELMNALLLSLPGTPVIYYGDEIGMGDNIYLGDRNGVRTPMQWSADRNAGFSRANPQQLPLPVIFDPEYHYEAVNVEAQQHNAHSLLHWMKRLIALRKRHRAFGRGTLEFLHPSNRKVLAFLRSYEDEHVLVVANLSRFVEYVDLDLSAHRGCVPVELFGGQSFPPIGELPYLLTLGPHSFVWFRITYPERGGVGAVRPEAPPVPTLRVRESWQNLLREERPALERALPGMLRGRRWFGRGREEVAVARLIDFVPAPRGEGALLVVGVQQEGALLRYALAVAFTAGREARDLRRVRPDVVLAEVEVAERAGGTTTGVLYDSLDSDTFRALLLDAVRRRRTLRGLACELVGVTTERLRELRVEDGELGSRVLDVEQSNTSIVYGRHMVLKLLRRLGDGVNPELEVGRFLSERARFAHVPPTLGALELRHARSEPVTLAILQGWVDNEGDAWRHALDEVARCYERVLAWGAETPPPNAHDLLGGASPSALAVELVGPYLESTRLLGCRTAELHRALASDREDPAFAPEFFTPLDQRALYQSIRNAASRAFEQLRNRLSGLPEVLAHDAAALAQREGELLNACRTLLDATLGGLRIRVHGDLHLGQVLHTGHDFVFLDFEGEPARSLGERRLKRPALRDVAGMLRSFDYAAQYVLLGTDRDALLRPQDVPLLVPWARHWRRWVGASFLEGYLPAAQEAELVPRERRALARLLRALLVEKAIYELSYELVHRPDWAGIPIRGLLELLDEEEDA